MSKVTLAPVSVGESFPTLKVTFPPGKSPRETINNYYTLIIAYKENIVILSPMPFQESLYRGSPSFQIGYSLVFHDGYRVKRFLGPTM